jgi:hypothetical protein
MASRQPHNPLTAHARIRRSAGATGGCCACWHCGSSRRLVRIRRGWFDTVAARWSGDQRRPTCPASGSRLRCTRRLLGTCGWCVIFAAMGGSVRSCDRCCRRCAHPTPGHASADRWRLWRGARIGGARRECVDRHPTGLAVLAALASRRARVCHVDGGLPAELSVVVD